LFGSEEQRSDLVDLLVRALRAEDRGHQELPRVGVIELDDRGRDRARQPLSHVVRLPLQLGAHRHRGRRIAGRPARELQAQTEERWAMPGVSVRTFDGSMERVEDTTVERFREQLRGELLVPGQEGYDKARSVWNGMIDRHPALIARCRGAADVMRSVALAHEHDLLLSIKGGGHNIAGKAVCEGGLMIDLSLMRDVTVDPKARRAWVGPGATLADFDHEAQAFGLATPLGINSTTGVAGLTLGGGFGWLTRKHGLTVDNLRSAQVVTADAELVRASEQENRDLFWGICGGGGNFGVVTSFELELHPVGPEVLAGLLAYPFDGADERLARYRDHL